MRKILFVMVLISILNGCIMYYGFITEDEYKAYLSVKNDSSGNLTAILIETWIRPENLYKDITTYYELSIGEQSLYKTFIAGKVYSGFESSSAYINTLKINYTLHDVINSVTVFDDGLSYSSITSYEDLTEEELEKVYLKNKTFNTLIVTDSGVELLQGE